MENQEQGVLYVRRNTDISGSLNPIKRRRLGENSAVYNISSSLVWHNLEKSKPVKYICTELDYYKRKANSSLEFPTAEQLKHRKQVSVTRNDVEVEKPEGEKEVSSSEPTSSTLIEHACSSTDFDDDEPSQPSDVVKEKKFRQPLLLSSRNTDIQIQTNVMISSERNLNTDPEDETIDELESEISESLDFEGANFQWEDSDTHLDSVYIGQKDVEDAALYDVDLNVTASYRPEKVPLVCLTSKFNSKAILGHPLEVEELINNYEPLLPRNENTARKLSGDAGTLHQLVWRTARRARTPVCYVTNLDSSIFKKANGRPVGEDVGNLFSKNKTQFKRGGTGTKPGITCVLVERVFRKLLAEVGHLQSYDEVIKPNPI